MEYLPAELLRKIASSPKLFGQLSCTCQVLNKILRDYICAILAETRRIVEPPLYVLYGNTHHGTYDNIYVNGKNIVVLLFEVNREYIAVDFYLDAIIRCSGNLHYLILEENHFRDGKRHGICFRWIFICERFHLSKYDAFYAYFHVEFSHGNIISHPCTSIYPHNIYIAGPDRAWKLLDW